MKSLSDYFYHVITDNDVKTSRFAENFCARCLKTIFSGLSFIYAFIVWQKALCYKVGLFRKKHLSQPVISIGNITWGGTGKTPLVELIVGYLQEKKIKPVVLTRGYMSKQRGCGQEKNSSDEGEMLQQSLNDVPILIGGNRIQSAQEALKKYPVDVFVLDDGFGHWKMARDLDIVLIDTTNPFGNGQLIPRGILREPLTALRRADLFVLTKTDWGKPNVDSIKQKLQRINPEAPIIETIHQAVGLMNMGEAAPPETPLFLKGKTVAAFCSVAQPGSFQNLLHSLGADLRIMKSFQDHHVYERDDILDLLKLCREKKVSILVTTHKDAVKLESFLELLQKEFLLFSLKVKIRITQGEDEFYGRISRLLDR